MANIFVSYAREDRARVEPFVTLLNDQGWSVWWDRALVPGHTFENRIDEEIQEAECVVVFWSKFSVKSDWVVAEAHEGMDRGILIPVLLDEVRVPLVFRRKQSAFLVDWPTRPDDSELNRVIAAIADILGGPVNLDAINLPSGRRRVNWALITIGIMLVAISSGYWLLNSTTKSSSASTENRIPDASITIMPFEGPDEILNSLSYEVSDILREIEDVYVTSNNQTREYSTNSDLKIDSRYLVTGRLLEASSQSSGQTLAVQLIDTNNSSTLWEKQIPVHKDNLARSATVVAREVASHFDRTISEPKGRDELNPNTYLQYLTGKAEARKPQTLEALNDTREIFARVVKTAPRFAQARAGLCETYINLYRETRSPANFEQAEKQCHRAKTLSPANSSVLGAMGRLYSTAGEYELAQNHFNEALAQTPYSTEILRGLARNYQRQQNYGEAEELLLTAIAIEPNYWTNYQSLASIYFATGDYEKAAKYFSSQAELVLQKAKALNNVGAAYFLLEAFDLAIDNWEQSLLEEPTPETYANLGSAYFFNHQYGRALDSYQAAVNLSPDDHRMWGNMGEALLFSGGDYQLAYRRAIEMAERQMLINPSDGEVLSSLSTYYAALGEDVTSLSYLDKALSVVGDEDINTVYDAAVTHSRLGNEKETGRLLNQLVLKGYSESLINRDANFKNQNFREPSDD